MPKITYPPLLAPGRHRFTLAEARAICVDAFRTSPNRHQLFGELLRLVTKLEALAFPCSIWIDGSFLSEKEEPEDIDVCIEFWVSDAEQLDPNDQSFLTSKLNGEKIFSPYLDTYICPRFAKDDSRHPADMEAYWGGVWGKGYDDWLKGYIIVTIGETDAQRRLFA